MKLLEKGPYIDACAGAGAGLVGTLIGYPLDVVKGQMQVHIGKTSMFRIFRQMYATQGVTGFYRGVIPPMVSLTLLNMTNFSSYSSMSKALQIDHSIEGEIQPLAFVAGAAVGPIASLISTPFEFLKIQLQFSARNNVYYKSTFDAAKVICKSRGVRTLYTGHLINTFREMIFLGTYFACYENIKKLLSTALPIAVAVPVSGGCAGSIGWLISFPLDGIKTTIQSVPIRPEESIKALSIRAALSEQLNRGFWRIYSGVSPSIIRAFIVSSTRFSAYEAIVRLLSSTTLIV